MTQQEQKEQIRQRLLEERTQIPDNLYQKKSIEICTHLKQLPEFKKAHFIHCYISMNSRREVNTHPLIKAMLEEGKKVVVPITQIKDGTLKHVRLKTFGELKENEWGVLEPADGEDVAVNQLELVIVPMAGGDRQRNRIGYGKGFYDRFLAQIHCPCVGLLFKQCLIEEIPVEKFDIALDLLVTENEIIS